MTLVETGTRGLIGAVIGSAAQRDEATLARCLLPLLRPGMLVLLDRAFDANAFLADIAATGAMLLARSKSTRNPPVLVLTAAQGADVGVTGDADVFPAFGVVSVGVVAPWSARWRSGAWCLGCLRRHGGGRLRAREGSAGV
jgi:hypothetical protein